MHCERPHGLIPFQSPGAHRLIWSLLFSHFLSAQENMETLGHTLQLRRLLLPNPSSSSLIPTLKQSHISPPSKKITPPVIPTVEKEHDLGSAILLSSGWLAITTV